MLTAVVLHPPRFGAKLKSFDAAKAKAVKGVRRGRRVLDAGEHDGVAVLAKDYWAAKKGRDALKVEWDESNAFKTSSADILAEYQQACGDAGHVGAQGRRRRTGARRRRAHARSGLRVPVPRARGDGADELRRASSTRDGCEIWNGEQFQTVDQMAVAQLLGLQARAGEAQPALRRRQLRPPRESRSPTTCVEAAAIAKASASAFRSSSCGRARTTCAPAATGRCTYHALKAGLDARRAISSPGSTASSASRSSPAPPFEA